MNQQQQSQQPPQQSAQQGNNNNGATGNPGVVMPPQQFPIAANLHAQQHQPMPPQHLMSLMSNPALAAAASSHPLFPPSAMLSNPGAFLAMQPEAFGVTAAAQRMGGTTQQQALQTPNPFAAAASAAATVSAQTSLALPPVASKSANIKLSAGTPGSGTLHHPHNPANLMLAQQNAELAKMTPSQRAKQNRDRNREHARSTRLRKKAYVQKLKELVEGLHAERADEVRARRVAVQHLAEKQQVRRGVVRSFLKFHSEYETEERKWKTILEEDFWLKQPVTPYRSFRRAEIEKVRACFWWDKEFLLLLLLLLLF